MLTVGVDLAADPARTAVAWIVWDGGRATVAKVATSATDEQLLEWLSHGDKVGLDCPLGWPSKFIDFISAHENERLTGVPEYTGKEWRRDLVYRETDLHMKRRFAKIQGLSVATDRIGMTTLRCATLLSRLATAGHHVDRTGAGQVVEVYPSASLLNWGLPHKGYKKGQDGKAHLNELVDILKLAARWLHLGEYEDACRKSDDAFDAVICALTARAALCGAVENIPPDRVRSAKVEGWIALPEGALDRLVEIPTR